MNKIEDFVEHQESPLINGLVFPEGSIQLFCIDVKWKTPINYLIKLGENTSIATLEKEDTLIWSDCTVLVKAENEKLGIEVLGGGGDYGSDGFVAVVNKSSKKLLWLAFFKCSNPFSKIEILNTHLKAYSTNNCVWQFPLENPSNFNVECSPAGV